jgi:hypothetical protein
MGKPPVILGSGVQGMSGDSSGGNLAARFDAVLAELSKTVLEPEQSKAGTDTGRMQEALARMLAGMAQAPAQLATDPKAKDALVASVGKAMKLSPSESAKLLSLTDLALAKLQAPADSKTVPTTMEKPPRQRQSSADRESDKSSTRQQSWTERKDAGEQDRRSWRSTRRDGDPGAGGPGSRGENDAGSSPSSGQRECGDHQHTDADHGRRKRQPPGRGHPQASPASPQPAANG